LVFGEAARPASVSMLTSVSMLVTGAMLASGAMAPWDILSIRAVP
jgi:hypothetical protein